MLFELFLVLGKAHLLTFKNKEIKEGDVYEGIIGIGNSYLDPKFIFSYCKTECLLQFLVYKTEDFSRVLSQNDGYKLKCCSESMNCPKGSLNILDSALVKKIELKSLLYNNSANNASIKTILLNQKDQKTENAILLENKTLWSYAIANCHGNMVIDGNLELISTGSRLDYRLSPFMLISSLGFICISILIGVWIFAVIRKQVSTDLNQYLYLGSAALIAFTFFLQSALFIIWIFTDSIPPMLTVMIAIIRASAIALSYYVALSYLQYPLEISIKKFSMIIIPFVLSSYLEMHGITHFNSKLNGSWYFGYGMIPCFDYLCTLISIITILNYAFRNPPKEQSDEMKRSYLLRALLVVSIIYIVSTLIVGVMRFKATVLDAAGKEWIGYMIYALFASSFAFINGYFWKTFNPSGYQAIGENEDDFALADDLDDVVDDTPIPKVLTKKKTFKKSKSDDDLFGMDMGDLTDSDVDIPTAGKFD